MGHPVNDMRLEDAERDIEEVQRSIAAAESIVRRLPREHQDDAREAMRCIFDAGRKLGVLDRMPEHPVDPDIVPVGSSLRGHIERCRDLHSEVLAASKMSDKVTGRHVRSMMRNDRSAA